LYNLQLFDPNNKQLEGSVEPIDVAYEKFKTYLEQVGDNFFNRVVTESDTRMKIIDPIFCDILGWSNLKVLTEDPDEAGRIDYNFLHEGISRLIVEAKKESRDLGFSTDYSARFFKLNGSVFKTEAAQEGITQVIRYCSEENAELGCVTNGRQWVIFRGSRLGDGTKTRDGLACVFSGLNEIEKNFKKFYDLLGFESVVSLKYRGIFQEAEGQPRRTSGFRDVVRRPNSKQHLAGDNLAKDLDRIMLSFFKELGDEDDPDSRRACFVTTTESDAAEQNLTRLSEELKERIQTISSSDPSELEEAIARAKEMQRHEMVLLVGTKGAGKTTFVERFFEDVLDSSLRKDCVVIRVDLAECGCNSQSIVPWLDQNLLAEAERAAFENRPDQVPEYEDLQGMFYGEYRRLKQVYKHEYESKKDEFKIRFGDRVEKLRDEQTNVYIIKLLSRIAHGFSKVPCVVFDNADHFDVPFQEAVFKYANAIYQKTVCLMMLPITDTTSWQLSKQGAMQSFFTDSYYLPTPDTALVLKRRIEFIEEKVRSDPKEKGTGYFFGKGIKLEVENIKAFAANLQTIFVDTGQTARWIGELSNGDIRRSLQLTRELVGSSHLRVKDLLTAYVSGSTVNLEEDSVLMGLICGKYDIYPEGVHSFVQNLFTLSSEFDTSPLTAVRILAYLESFYKRNPDNDHRYVPVDKLIGFFGDMGVPRSVTINVVTKLHVTGLVLAYDPTIEEILPDHRIQISLSGILHLAWALENWVYIENMAYVTPIMNEDAFKEIAMGDQEKRADILRKSISAFVNYMQTEDTAYVSIPPHEIYELQTKIGERYKSQLKILERHPADAQPGRYSRATGEVKNWNREKGFGFIRPRIVGDDLFVHISDIIGSDDEFLTEGTILEFDVAHDPGRKGPKAINARKISN